MPIYEYRCPSCGNEQEVLLPISEAIVIQICSECGKPTERRMSLFSNISSLITGRGKVLRTLNKEDGYGLPTRPSDRPRLEAVLAKGLDQRHHRPVVGRGFQPCCIESLHGGLNANRSNSLPMWGSNNGYMINRLMEQYSMQVDCCPRVAT